MASYKELTSVDVVEVVNNQSRSLTRSRHRLQSLIHLLKLTIVGQWARQRHTKELPKVAIYNDKLMAVLYSFTHFLPLTAAVTLVALNMSPIVMDGYSTTANPGFQFAAKLLEILMQASMTSILLGIVRELVLTEDGIPLGSIFAPLQTTNISFLWSLELWGSISASSVGRTRRMVLFACSFVIIVLAALVGPTGAILMIPRPLSMPGNPVLYVLDDLDTLFPKETNYSNYDLEKYFRSEFDIRQTMLHIDLALNVSKPGQTSFDVLDRWGTRKAYTHLRDGYFYITLSTALLMQIFGMYSGNQVNNGELLSANFSQPVAGIKCHQNYVTMRVSPVLSPTLNESYLDFGPDFEDLNHAVTWQQALQPSGNASDGYKFASTRAIDAPESSKAHSALILQVDFYKSNETDYMFFVEACVLDAFWKTTVCNYSVTESRAEVLQVDAIFDVETNDGSRPIILDSAHANNFIRFWHESRQLMGSEIPLKFDTLLMAIVLALSYISPSMMTSTVWPEPEGTMFLNSLAASGVLAGLGGGLDNVRLWTTTAWSDPTVLTQLMVTGKYESYGYGPADMTVKLSFVVFGTYCMLVITHLWYTLITGRVGSDWNTLSELFMLALNSKQPEHIGHASVGIRSMATYKEPVSVKVSEKESLELTFTNDPGMRQRTFTRVEANREY